MMTKQSNKKTIQYGMASLEKYQFASFVSIWFILKFLVLFFLDDLSPGNVLNVQINEKKLIIHTKNENYQV